VVPLSRRARPSLSGLRRDELLTGVRWDAHVFSNVDIKTGSWLSELVNAGRKLTPNSDEFGRVLQALMTLRGPLISCTTRSRAVTRAEADPRATKTSRDTRILSNRLTATLGIQNSKTFLCYDRGSIPRCSGICSGKCERMA
jgi:hypothetical protein